MVLTKVPGTLIADASITSTDIQDTTITNAKMAVDPSNASNLSSGSVPSAQLSNVPTDGLQGDIALLAFKTQANGNLARYNLVDQSVDAFEDASGVNSGASTGASRNAAGKYYSGVGSVTATGGTITTDGDYTVHKFTADGTFTTDTAQSVEYLVVAGGGGSGCQRAADGGSGGGGAGGYRAATGFPVTATSYSITVGAGGARGIENSPAENGVDGGNSVFSTITAEGGGGGGTNNSGGGAGGSGGSGDGGAGSAARTDDEGTGTYAARRTAPRPGASDHGRAEFATIGRADRDSVPPCPTAPDREPAASERGAADMQRVHVTHACQRRRWLGRQPPGAKGLVAIPHEPPAASRGAHQEGSALHLGPTEPPADFAPRWEGADLSVPSGGHGHDFAGPGIARNGESAVLQQKELDVDAVA